MPILIQVLRSYQVVKMPLILYTLVLVCWGLIPACISDVTGRGLYDYGFDAIRQYEKRQIHQPPVVSGCPRINGSLGYRREIREIEVDSDLWNLFMLGLNWMQYMDQQDSYSWYQIAGMGRQNSSSSSTNQ
jgi:hypothetical protein